MRGALKGPKYNVSEFVATIKVKSHIVMYGHNKSITSPTGSRCLMQCQGVIYVDRGLMQCQGVIYVGRCLMQCQRVIYVDVCVGQEQSERYVTSRQSHAGVV